MHVNFVIRHSDSNNMLKCMKDTTLEKSLLIVKYVIKASRIIQIRKIMKWHMSCLATFVTKLSKSRKLSRVMLEPMKEKITQKKSLFLAI